MGRRTVTDSRSILVHWMGPGDANAAGYVHGGTMMKLLDDDGRPATVPDLAADSAEERRRKSEAPLRRRNRLAEREQVRAARDA